jgi:hypothetical protein
VLIDWILSDGSTGVDLAAEVTARGMLVLMMTGALETEALDLAGYRTLHKPFKARELLMAVEDAIAQRGLLGTYRRLSDGTILLPQALRDKLFFGLGSLDVDCGIRRWMMYHRAP